MAEISRFKYDTNQLSPSERKVVKLLEKVGVIVHKIWEKQVDSETRQQLFYPSDLSREELMQAAKRNASLLSPFTIVKRDKNRKLYAVWYHQEYKKEHEMICTLLDQASMVTEDRKLSSYFSSISRFLKNGQFDKILDLFLTTKDHKIDILIGPFESYNDDFMDIKRSYQYSLRILRDGETDNVRKMMDVVTKMAILKPTGSVAATLNPNKIRFRVDDVLMFAGRQAGSMPSSTNLPNQPELVKWYGVKIVVYHNSLIKKFDTQLKPLLKTFKGVKTDRKRGAMSAANYRMVILHEVAEGIIKFRGMEKRLGEYFDIMRELNADIFGVRSAKYHVLAGLISVEEYNEMLIAFLLFAINVCNRAEKDSSIMVYAKGFNMFFNFVNRSGAIKLGRNTITVDLEKLSIDIDRFSDIVLTILSKGNADDVAKLMTEWSDQKIMKKLPKVVR